jgi:hypothetical protein
MPDLRSQFVAILQEIDAICPLLAALYAQSKTYSEPDRATNDALGSAPEKTMSVTPGRTEAPLSPQINQLNGFSRNISSRILVCI